MIGEVPQDSTHYVTIKTRKVFFKQKLDFDQYFLKIPIELLNKE